MNIQKEAVSAIGNFSQTTGVLKRYTGNPVLTPADMPVPCCAVYNSGVIKTNAGDYIMASRFERPSKEQLTWISRSKDGYQFTPDPEPMSFKCLPEEQEEFDAATKMAGPGIGTWWDPRLNQVEKEYYITYAAVSADGCRIGLGRVDAAFKTSRHVSFPHHIENRNAVLFPEKIKGEYWMLHRPSREDDGKIWISSSPDLKYWGNTRVVARGENYWENRKIGPGAPLVKTEQGFLTVYHGVFTHCSGINYGIGVMLLDLEQPWKVVARAKDPILYVSEPYEMIGQVPNVIFPGGVIPEKDGTVKVYYGAADYVQCLATGKFRDLIDFCFKG
ncbi:MAG TPA: glycoside hydrolase family 130 protein [Spirochaetota bacterium]|nr:glycoside hydrolase family 130 protein [Spirochaetota bacterium]